MSKCPIEVLDHITARKDIDAVTYIQQFIQFRGNEHNADPAVLILIVRQLPDLLVDLKLRADVDTVRGFIQDQQADLVDGNTSSDDDLLNFAAGQS